jgi:hypothetical protein
MVRSVTRGGARSRSGPAPDPNALRRERDHGDWLRLPAAGRSGDPPDWPLTKPSRRELTLWAALWRTPQAIVWEAQHEEYAVALLVRAMRQAERPRAAVNLQTLVRQYMEALGLAGALGRSKQWTIDDPETAAPAERRPTGTEAPSARTRLKLVSPGG